MPVRNIAIATTALALIAVFALGRGRCDGRARRQQRRAGHRDHH